MRPAIAEAAKAAAGEDFGRIVRRLPRTVLRPGTLDEVVEIVRRARVDGVHIAARGQGHGTNGHGLVEDGIVLDLRSMDSIQEAGVDEVTVGAGATWGKVVSKVLDGGSTPPVLTDYLGLSVGGTLSVGGLSGGSFRHGAQVDHVTELEVVTGSGHGQRCSPSTNRELFEAALAGLGQFGIITRATLRLVPAPEAVRVFRLRYEDVSTMLADAVLIVQQEEFDHVLGILALEDGGRCSCSIEAARNVSPPSRARMADAALFAGLRCIAGATEAEDRPFLSWADRVSERVTLLKSLGAWDLPHPWVDLFVRGAAIAEFLDHLLAQPVEDDVGPLRILLNPLRPSRFTRPMLRVPSEGVVFLCDVLRTAPADDSIVRRMLDRNRELFELNRKLGGLHYPISSIQLGPSDWAVHFGDRWEWLSGAKDRFDPDGILTPGPGIF